MEGEPVDGGAMVIIFIVGWLLLPITLIAVVIWCVYTGVQIGKEIAQKEREGIPIEEQFKEHVH